MTNAARKWLEEYNTYMNVLYSDEVLYGDYLPKISLPPEPSFHKAASRIKELLWKCEKLEIELKELKEKATNDKE